MFVRRVVPTTMDGPRKTVAQRCADQMASNCIRAVRSLNVAQIMTMYDQTTDYCGYCFTWPVANITYSAAELNKKNNLNRSIVVNFYRFFILFFIAF